MNNRIRRTVHIFSCLHYFGSKSSRNDRKLAHGCESASSPRSVKNSSCMKRISGNLHKLINLQNIYLKHANSKRFCFRFLLASRIVRARYTQLEIKRKKGGRIEFAYGYEVSFEWCKENEKKCVLI